MLTYLGPLLIACGLLWNSLEGWRVLDLILAPGRMVQPPEARGFALNLVSADGATGSSQG